MAWKIFSVDLCLSREKAKLPTVNCVLIHPDINRSSEVATPSLVKCSHQLAKAYVCGQSTKHNTFVKCYTSKETNVGESACEHRSWNDSEEYWVWLVTHAGQKISHQRFSSRTAEGIMEMEFFQHLCSMDRACVSVKHLKRQRRHRL